MKGELSCDPRGLIFEAYRIDGIEETACRAIFFDWALGVPEGENPVPHIKQMLAFYGDDAPMHPMTKILIGGCTAPLTPRRRARIR